MKNTSTCPKCSSRTLYAVDLLNMPDPLRHEFVSPLTLTTFAGALRFSDATRAGPHNVHLEAWVCADCAYTELYALDLETLEALAAQGEGWVRKIETKSDGPFR